MACIRHGYTGYSGTFSSPYKVRVASHRDYIEGGLYRRPL